MNHVRAVKLKSPSHASSGASRQSGGAGSLSPTGFKTSVWQRQIDVRDFIQNNYTPYTGDEGFLAPATVRTEKLWRQVVDLMKQERDNNGVLDMDTGIVSSIISHDAGYIDQSLEQIVGLQTDKPLKRALMPFGGLRVAEDCLNAYGYKIAPEIDEIFSKYRKTHNEGVFNVYSDTIKKARKAGIVTGLPDGYGRGRIIGDYRRVALYGTTRLIEDKRDQFQELDGTINEETIRLREEISEQIKALHELELMAKTYGFDVTRPAKNAREAVQWTYLAYLAAIKEQNGAAMSLGRISNFLDIYIERDMQSGLLAEAEAQELIDHLVMKLRMVRFARTPDYNELFSGDPTWVTECLGGIGEDGRPLVTKTAFRFLHTLTTLGPAPEPNLTVLWSERMPEAFKKYCARVSIETSSIQYENDELMRPYWGDDYGIACCVSAMRIGKQLQFFGARVNLAKALLYAINGGRDEMSGDQVAPAFAPVTADVLDYEEVKSRLDTMMDWLAGTYIDALNIIHYMHDKYCYERIEMALHDRDVMRTMACGVAGVSVTADSLSAIKYAKVHVKRDTRGLATGFSVEGDYPQYGNNDDRADDIAIWLVENFMKKLRTKHTYRNAVPTQSVLTITSNVVYGKKTGCTPCGRKAGEPFAPGANPMHGRDKKGALASLFSISKLPYEHAQDGISNTFSIVPEALGKTAADRVNNLVGMMDGYFGRNAHHMNVNVFNRETLLDAMDHPENYPQLTIRVSGYAVNFIKLTREQQQDVINRTFHRKM
ncbi:MAG: formate C-acetyltransferase [Alphaproteobacteria bacterium]|nr:formate C-acetyltransferase [Alphaproteobacteria bacterium]